MTGLNQNLTSFLFIFRRFIRRTRAEETQEAETIACRRERRECSETQVKLMDRGRKKGCGLTWSSRDMLHCKSDGWISPVLRKPNYRENLKILYTAPFHNGGKDVLKLAAIKSKTITVPLPLCVNSTCASGCRYLLIVADRVPFPKYWPLSMPVHFKVLRSIFHWILMAGQPLERGKGWPVERSRLPPTTGTHWSDFINFISNLI